jgi:putative endonuclease
VNNRGLPFDFCTNARSRDEDNEARRRKLAGVAQRIDTGDSRLLRGIAAEGIAAEYLEARGIVVLARNVRCKTGELDLVCRDGDVLMIVEVRQRGGQDFGGALASVTWRKQRKIVRAARFFLQRHLEWRDYPVRFDVIGLEGLPDCTHELIWVKDAFRAT